jgi:hypothetical protein
MTDFYIGIGIDHKKKSILFLSLGFNEETVNESCAKRVKIPWKVFKLHDNLIDDFYEWFLDNDFTNLEAQQLAEETIQTLLNLKRN